MTEPNRPSLTQGLRRAIRLRPDGVAVIDGAKRFSWRETADRVARLAAVLRARGLVDGGRVILLSLNTHRSIETFFVAIHAGGVVVPLNHRLSESELVSQVADAAPSIIILGDGFGHFASAFGQAAGGDPPIIWAGETDASGRAVAFEAELAAATPIDDAGREGDDLACILYTSGTTSAAKGVMLSHMNLIANTLNTVGALDLDETSVHLHHGPLFHVAPAARLFSVTHVGATHVLLPRFVAREVIAEIERTGITHATFVPTMFRALLDEPALAESDMQSLSVISYGSAPMPEALLDEMMAALPGARFLQSYGMTELSPVVTILGWRDHLPENRRPGLLRSAGQPVLLADVAVVGLDGNRLNDGQTGEIVARGPNRMLGYWNKPELTAEALRGGWMHTGDAGYFDEYGYLHVVDRLKDMIISGGENVYSQEVENAIATHPAVSECAVFGRPHPHWGEAVHAVVRLKSGAQVEAQGIIDYCRDRIAHYKCPRTLEIRTEPMPLSGANKILKAKLRAELLLSEAGLMGRSGQ